MGKNNARRGLDLSFKWDKDKFSCTDIAAEIEAKGTENNHVYVFASLLCSFAQRGYLHRDNWEEDIAENKRFHYLIKSLPLLYKELFPGWKWEGEDKQHISIDWHALGKLLRQTQSRTDWKQSLLDFAEDFEGKVGMFATGAHELLLSEEERVREIVTAHTFSQRADDCISTCQCGIQEVKFTGTVGFTAGYSPVGFCDPDGNPLQIHYDLEYKRSFADGDQCNEDEEFHTTQTLTVTFALGTFFQFDLLYDLGTSPESFLEAITPPAVQLRFLILMKGVAETSQQETDIRNYNAALGESAKTEIKGWMEWLSNWIQQLVNSAKVNSGKSGKQAIAVVERAAEKVGGHATALKEFINEYLTERIKSAMETLNQVKDKIVEFPKKLSEQFQKMHADGSSVTDAITDPSDIIKSVTKKFSESGLENVFLSVVMDAAAKALRDKVFGAIGGEVDTKGYLSCDFKYDLKKTVKEITLGYMEIKSVESPDVPVGGKAGAFFTDTTKFKFEL